MLTRLLRVSELLKEIVTGGRVLQIDRGAVLVELYLAIGLIGVVFQRRRGVADSHKLGALCVAQQGGGYRDIFSRLVVLHLHVHVAIVQRTEHLFQQIPQLLVSDLLQLVEGLKLWQILVVDGIPVQSQLFLIVPQCIALVQTIPQHLELAGIAGLGFAKRQLVLAAVAHQRVALFTACTQCQ